MRTRHGLPAIAAMLLFGAVAVAGDTINGLPLHVERLSDGAIRLWVGDHVSSTAVSALATDKGIVVIDTTESPSVDRQLRKAIAGEFGRDDFVYLINTHEHGDHTSGNAVYADCEIIAHELCAEGMRRRLEDSARIIAWQREQIPELERELAGLDEATEAYKKLRERIIVSKMSLASLESGAEPTFPTRTFRDFLKLDMGNMTLELYHMGGTHTASDIFVFVPEENLLFTGDMLADLWLTDTPGCLQAFAMREGVERDIPRLLRHWESLIAREDEIRDYVPAHWNGDLTQRGFVERYGYVKTLHDGITRAVNSGRRLEELLSELSLQAKFPDLDGTPGFTESWVHNGSLLALWSDATGATSASNALAAKIDEKDARKAVEEILAERSQDPDRYYFLEAELNALGYRYLGQDKLDEALAVFELNVELNPASWNVYDSLGEALMKTGRLDPAIANYSKSVELNPDNDNGRRMLEEIRATLAEGS